ncbi:MAG: zinc-ribbon domain-containing protein [Candidatus Heimdallarchaeota archaeon]
MANTYCTNCGKVISETARFCRFCGTPVRSRSIRSRAEPGRSAPQPQQVTPKMPTAAPPVAVEKIPDKIVENLYARRRNDQIKKELKKMLEEVSELSKKVEIGLIDAEDSNQQVNQLQSRISALQTEKTELKLQPFELEALTESEKKWQERLEKLEEKNRAQALSTEVYASLRDEYAMELSSIQQKTATETRKAKRWLVDLQKEVRVLDTQIEQAKVRGEIEEAGESGTKSQIEKLKTERKKKAVAAEVLTEILSNR